MDQDIKIVPSILSADFACLGEQVKLVEKAGAQMIHVDVMDGHFVPNITVGPIIVEALRRVITLPIDVHLMITNPDSYIEAFIEAGANLVSVHIETVPHINRLVNKIRQLGAKAGVAINPGTSLLLLEEILPYVDFVLLMTVNPGFGGQQFIESSFRKIEQLKYMIQDRNLSVSIEVDGGVNQNNIKKLFHSGASWFVAGASVFATPDPAEAVRSLLEAAAKK